MAKNGQWPRLGTTGRLVMVVTPNNIERILFKREGLCKTNTVSIPSYGCGGGQTAQKRCTKES
eukprot:scaffold267_cov192-Amphora_coffeaeformis.AAC.18